MSDPIYVAFATQKGGVGKSTLTALVASYLYYVEDAYRLQNAASIASMSEASFFSVAILSSMFLQE